MMLLHLHANLKAKDDDDQLQFLSHLTLCNSVKVFIVNLTIIAHILLNSLNKLGKRDKM